MRDLKTPVLSTLWFGSLALLTLVFFFASFFS